MKRRIFVAIPISESLQNEILRWEQSWRKLPVRWLAGKNLHITLIPPWYVNDNELKDVKRDIKKTVGAIKPFEIHFHKVSYGPHPRSPRLIWAEGVTRLEIGNLKREIERVLDKKPEERSFTLHLTLARFRPQDFSQFPIKRLDEKIDWCDTVNSFALMESRLSRQGADYEVCEKINL